MDDRATDEAATDPRSSGTLKVVARNAAERCEGWTASVDSDEFGVRADVLCRKGDIRVALNFADDPSDTRAVLERHETLERAGVRTAWFFREYPDVRFDTTPTVVFTEAESWRLAAGMPPDWSFAGVRLGTEAAVGALLAGHFRHRTHLVLTGPYVIQLDPAPMRCWKCECEYVGIRQCVARIDGHGEYFDPSGSEDVACNTAQSRIAGSLVARVLAEKPWPDRLVGLWMAHAGAEGTQRWGNACPSCRAEQTEQQVEHRLMTPVACVDGLQSVLYRLDAPASAVRFAHWCYRPSTETGTHCAPLAVPAPDRPVGRPVRIKLTTWTVRNRTSVWFDSTNLVGPTSKRGDSVAIAPGTLTPGRVS